MSDRPVLGIVGTIVWDTIYRPGHEPVHDWGGIVYSLAGALAAADRVKIRLIAKVGTDVADGVRDMIDALPVAIETALVEVGETNNRVELMYVDEAERVERLTGGVPPWSIEELREAIDGCDALFVNFVSGYELDLPTAKALQFWFAGPIHADLHSLFLGRRDDGTRVPRRLPKAYEWLRCFDSVQMNDPERRLLGLALNDVVSGDDMPELAFMTRGAKGASYAQAGTDRPGVWSVPDGTRTVNLGRPPIVADPTGCGDVWGGAIATRLLEGDEPRRGMEIANRLASAAVTISGAGGLADRLIERRRELS